MPVIGERNGRRPLIEEAKLLQKRVRNRQRQLQRLLEEHQQLQLQYQLLASIGETLAELRNKDADPHDPLASEEAMLLQQLLSQSVTIKQEPGCSTSDSMQKPSWQHEQQPQTETIAPQDKPLQLITSLMAQPPFPVSETYPTVQDLSNEYAIMIRDLSLALQQHAAGSAAVQLMHTAQTPLEKIKAVMLRFLHLLCTLSLPCARPNSDKIAMQLYTINCDTGQPLSESNPQHYAWAVSQLGLTRQQQINIATGFAVFKRLIWSVLNEQRQAGIDAGAGAGAVPETGAKKGGKPASSNAQAQQEQQRCCELTDMAEPFAHRMSLDLQQRRLERLQRLQRKEMLMRVLAGGYLWGCMSWDQLAKLHVLMFPIAPIPGMVAAAVAHLEQCQEYPSTDMGPREV